MGHAQVERLRATFKPLEEALEPTDMQFRHEFEPVVVEDECFRRSFRLFERCSEGS